MTVCKKKNIVKTQLCTGELDKWLYIYERSLDTTTADELQADYSWYLIKEVWGAVETSSGLMNFDGVNLNLRESIGKDGTLITHIFYIFYDSTLPTLENGNHFIIWNDNRYKILSVKNDNETNSFMQIFTTNRGDDELDATEA